MSAYGLSLDEVADGLTMPQFNLLAKMRQRRVLEDRRWQLSMASFSIQSKEQGEALERLMDDLNALDGSDEQADMGGGFPVSKRYPLLHEITSADLARDKNLRKIVKFRTVTE